MAASPVSPGAAALLGIGLALCAAPGIAGAQCSVASGERVVPLVELYTSEGCSSCPPADRWLSALAARGDGPQRVVPLAFHVDYWDYLGWEDRFASSAYSRRQRDAAARARASTVYTPQVVVNGQDFRAWYMQDRFRQAVDLVAARQASVAISLSAEPRPDGTQVVAEAAPRGESLSASSALYVAYFENGHVSEVKAGENRGERLRHDHVVRRLLGPAQPGADGRMRIAGVLPAADPGARGAGVAAFVQDLKTGEVLQALVLPACL